MASQDHPAEDQRVPARPLIMRYAARSDVGRIRAKNDDSAYAGRHLAVVADGMGGHAGGDVASAATVLDMIHLDHDGYDGDATTVLADEIQTANSLLSELVHINPKLAGMGTTVTALLLADGKLHFAHIGDSRAYRLRQGVFEQISVDHTFVQRLIEEGRLHPDEAETHPHKNVLMRVLGDVDASPELDLDELDVEPGERWLLCSDGLNYVAGHVIERTVRETKDLRECVETLVDLTLEAGSPDNVTVVMLEIAEETSDDVNTAAVEVVPAVVTAVKEDPGASVDAAAAGPSPASVISGAKAPSNHQHDDGLTDGRKDKVRAASLDGKPNDSAPEVTDPEETVPQETIPEETTAEASAPVGAAAGTNSGNGDASTDPHLGEHLSAEVLREELASRPHDLVGAAASAAATGSIPTIAGRTVARRAATVLTHKAEPGAFAEQDDEVLLNRPRRWVTAGIAAALLLILATGLWLGYAWTQTRYYIGEHDSKVAIFNGVSQRLGPFQLSTLQSVTEIPMDSLPAFSQQRVRQTVPASDLYDAQRIVQNLKTTGVTSPEDECLPPSPSPSATTSAPAATEPASAEAAQATPASPPPSPPSASAIPSQPSPTATPTCVRTP